MYSNSRDISRGGAVNVHKLVKHSDWGNKRENIYTTDELSQRWIEHSRIGARGEDEYFSHDVPLSVCVQPIFSRLHVVSAAKLRQRVFVCRFRPFLMHKSSSAQTNL